MRIETDRRPGLGDVRDQGRVPTCLSHAVSTSHEFSRMNRVTLSADYLHHFSSGGDWSQGSSVAAVRTALAENGQPEEKHCPVPAARTGWMPPSGLSVYRRNSAERSYDFDQMVEAIKSNCLPVLCISLPEPFFTPKAPWSISPDGIVRGFHAVVGVGVGSDVGGTSILIRNSWGPSWGDGGHAWLGAPFLKRHLRRMILLGTEVV